MDSLEDLSRQSLDELRGQQEEGQHAAPSEVFNGGTSEQTKGPQDLGQLINESHGQLIRVAAKKTPPQTPPAPAPAPVTPPPAQTKPQVPTPPPQQSQPTPQAPAQGTGGDKVIPRQPPSPKLTDRECQKMMRECKGSMGGGPDVWNYFCKTSEKQCKPLDHTRAERCRTLGFDAMKKQRLGWCLSEFE